MVYKITKSSVFNKAGNMKKKERDFECIIDEGIMKS